MAPAWEHSYADHIVPGDGGGMAGGGGFTFRGSGRPYKTPLPCLPEPHSSDGPAECQAVQIIKAFCIYGNYIHLITSLKYVIISPMVKSVWLPMEII